MIKEEQQIIPTGLDELTGKVGDLFREGYRLVQVGCTKTGDRFEINYSFDKDYRFLNLRVDIGQGEALPSISGIYFGAFIYENEIHDLYGITVNGMNIDFKGTLYRTSVRYPFAADTSREDDTCQGR